MIIDLHMHTTASDGTSTAGDLVERAARAGISTMSVTDHDTMAAVPAAAAAAARHGLTVVPGIEVTTVDHAHDVHVLGYFLDAASPALQRLLAKLRAQRIERAHEMAERLAAAGAPIDADALFADPALLSKHPSTHAPQSSRTAASTHPSTHGSARSIGRPQIARMLIAAGHVASVAEAFDRFLSEGCCAYVPHRGPSPAEAVAVIREAGGVASLAHPGTLQRDELVPPLVDRGLAAIEVYHSAHDAAAREHYLQLARAHDLAVTGGSDFHGDGARRSEFFGVTSLPADEYERLLHTWRSRRSPIPHP